MDSYHFSEVYKLDSIVLLILEKIEELLDLFVMWGLGSAG